jgi:hypothetical protein
MPWVAEAQIAYNIKIFGYFLAIVDFMHISKAIRVTKK